MITSTSNQQIKRLIRLVKKSKERKAEGVFVAEGLKMVSEAPEGSVQELYVSESFLERPEMAAVEKRNYEVLSDRVFQTVSDTKTPQGVLALIKMPSYSMQELCKKENGLYLVLETIQDPGNLGTMFRTGEGAGVSGIIMNSETVDLFNPKTIRSTMGSIYRVPFVIAEDLDSALQQLKKTGTTVYAAHLKGSCSYDKKDYTKKTAFLIGNEGNGLREETAAMADEYIKIPMGGQLESLNAAMAAGILMYEVRRQRS